MAKTTVHFQGRGDEQREFPVLPRSGELFDSGDGLWRMVDVVFGAAGVELYVVRVADALSAELRLQWSAWDAPVAVVETDALPGQRPLFS